MRKGSYLSQRPLLGLGESIVSSLIRRMERAAGLPKRRKPSGLPHFGTKLGVTNPVKAKRHVARGSRRGTNKRPQRMPARESVS